MHKHKIGGSAEHSLPADLFKKKILPHFIAYLIAGLAFVLVMRLINMKSILLSFNFADGSISYPLAMFSLMAVNFACAYYCRGLFYWSITTQILIVGLLWGFLTVTTVISLLLFYTLIGWYLLKKLAVTQDFLRDSIFALGVGLVAFGWVMQGISFLPIHNGYVYSGLLMFSLWLGRNQIRIWVHDIIDQYKFWTRHEERSTRISVSFACSAVIVFAYITRIPEMGTDSLMTHLAVTNQIVRDGRFVPNINELTWAYIQKPMHFAYLPVHILVGEYGLRFMHATLGILATFAVSASIVRAGVPMAGWFTAAFILGSPLLLQESASIFVDCYLSLIAVISTRALIQCWEDGLPIKESIVVGGLFGGLAATKFHGLIFAPLLAVIFLYALFRNHRAKNIWFATCAVVSSFITVMLPSYLIPWIATGNPLFPIFNSIFKAPGFPIEPFRFPFAKPPIDIVMWLNMVSDGAPYLEASGPVSMFHIYFFAPIVLVGLFVWRKPVFIIPSILGLGHMMLVVVVQNYLRYHTAGFFVLSLATGLAIGWLWQHHIVRFSLVAASSIILAGNGLYMVKGSYLFQGIPIWDLSTREGQKRLEAWRTPERQMVRTADALLRPDERAAIIWHSYIGLSRTDLLPLHPFFSYIAWKDFSESIAADNPIPFFNKYKISHIIIRHNIKFKDSDRLMAWLNKHSQILKTNDGAALYRIEPEQLYNETLIPLAPVTTWERLGDPKVLPANRLRVSSQNLALHHFKTQPGEFLKLGLRARCQSGDSIWLHINWYDDKDNYLHPTIVNQRCSSFTDDFKAYFTAPANASRGAVILDTLPNTLVDIEAAILKKRGFVR